MLRKEEARNRRSQARTVYKHLKGTHNKGRIAEEPGEGKLSSPVLEQRWAGRLTHRLSQIERHDFARYPSDPKKSTSVTSIFIHLHF
jgi:hypothetical protein